jgi:lysophospholipase L1-like esterase
VLVVGDSLAVGTKPFLPDMLGGRHVLTAAKNGITTPQGMDIVRRELRVVTPRVVVISLGSNDGSDPQRFADRLRRTMALLPADACVVWSTIIRPPRKGEYRGLNRVLHQAKRRDWRIVVVDWEHAVTGGAVYLPDGLHADEAGYRYRSAMIADAVNTQCAARAAAADA